jgi:hypothetical protein
MLLPLYFYLFLHIYQFHSYLFAIPSFSVAMECKTNMAADTLPHNTSTITSDTPTVTLKLLWRKAHLLQYTATLCIVVSCFCLLVQLNRITFPLLIRWQPLQTPCGWDLISNSSCTFCPYLAKAPPPHSQPYVQTKGPFKSRTLLFSAIIQRIVESNTHICNVRGTDRTWLLASSIPVSMN